MLSMNRRAFAAGALALSAPKAALAFSTKLKVLLHTGYSGPVAFMLLAQERGYVAQEGLEIDLVEGGGAAAIVPQVKAPYYDGGYGDMAALIETIASYPPGQGPVAVYATFNKTPFTIAVAANGPIRTAKDLEGKTLLGGITDAALLTFDIFCKAAGVNRAKVKVVRTNGGESDSILAMLNGQGVDGVFGFVNTLIAAAGNIGIDGGKELRHIEYADYVPDWYGNTVFVTRDAHDKAPAAVRGMVRAFNHALADADKNPDVAIDAMMRRKPSLLRDVNRRRFVGTMRSDMGAPGPRMCVGDLDDARLGRMIAQIAEGKKLPRTPSVSEVFDRAFLPPASEQIKAMST